MSETVVTTSESQEEHPEQRRPHAEGGEHGAHPSDAKYIAIALFLAGVTLVEVILSYLKVAYLTNLSLVALAIVKFATVAMFFMHLRFDSRILRRLFLTGIVLAIFVYIAVLLTFGVFVKPSTGHYTG